MCLLVDIIFHKQGDSLYGTDNTRLHNWTQNKWWPISEVWHFGPTKDRMVNSKPQTGGNNNGME